MEIILNNRIRVKDPPEIIKNLLIEKLLVDNPKFLEAEASGRSTWGIDKNILNFATMPDGSFLVPRGIRQWLVKQAEEVLGPNNFTITDERTIFEYTEVDSSSIKYRPYQLEAVTNLVSDSPEGVLVAPAGSGKTVMGLSLIPLMGQPALWLTHTGTLAEQAKERAEFFLPNIGEIGLFGRSTWEKGDLLTIGMIQTLIRNPEKLIKMRDEWGLVILDECLPKDTNILMLDGHLKDISEVKNGDVTTFGKVTHKFSRQTNELIELRGGWDKLSGTITHRLPVIKNKNTNSLKHLVENDVVVSTMSEINRGDLLLVKENNCHTDKNTVEPVRRVVYHNVTYRCMKILTKKVVKEITTVYDFTTEDHFFIANGVLSSNCHHCPSRTFLEVLQHLNPYYMYGLTATPYRRDKLEMLMFQTLGETKTIIPIKKVEEHGGIIVPKVRCRAVISKQIDGNNIQEILKVIISNKKRNNMIVSDVIAEATAGHFCIVISDRRVHCETLHNLIQTKWKKTDIVTGKYNRKHINRQVDRYNKNEITVLVATFALLGEGFDVPFLDRAFIAMPFRAEAKTEQLIGRIQRAYPGKKDAIVYDYIDINIGVLENQFSNRKKASRRRAYNRLGVEIEHY